MLAGTRPGAAAPVGHRGAGPRHGRGTDAGRGRCRRRSAWPPWSPASAPVPLGCSPLMLLVRGCGPVAGGRGTRVLCDSPAEDRGCGRASVDGWAWRSLLAAGLLLAFLSPAPDGPGAAASPRSTWTVTADSEELTGENGAAANVAGRRPGDDLAHRLERRGRTAPAHPHDRHGSASHGGAGLPPAAGGHRAQRAASGSTASRCPSTAPPGGPGLDRDPGRHATTKTLGFTSATARYVRLTAMTEAGNGGPGAARRRSTWWRPRPRPPPRQRRPRRHHRPPRRRRHRRSPDQRRRDRPRPPRPPRRRRRPRPPLPPRRRPPRPPPHRPAAAGRSGPPPPTARRRRVRTGRRRTSSTATPPPSGTPLGAQATPRCRTR